jgi:hypothetical protein
MTKVLLDHWSIDISDVPLPPEESDILKDPTVDLDILVAVDAIQANDELLGTTVKAALEQSNPDWRRVVDFLAGTIENRIPWLDSEIANNDQLLVNAASLSRCFRESVMDIFISCIAPYPEKIFDPTALEDCQVSTKRAISVLVVIAEHIDLDFRLSVNLHGVFAKWLTILSRNDPRQAESRRLIWRSILPVACKMYEDKGNDILEKKLELLQLIFKSIHLVSANLRGEFTQTQTVLGCKRELWFPLRNPKRMLIRDTAISLLRHITLESPLVDSGILHSVIITLCGAARVDLQYDMDALRGSVYGALSRNTKMDWDIPAIKTILQSWISQHPDYISFDCGVEGVCSTTREFSPGIPLMVDNQNIETFVSAIEDTARSVCDLTQAVNLCLVTLQCYRPMGLRPAFYHSRPRRPTFEILAIMLNRFRSFHGFPQEGVPSAYPDYMDLAKRAVELITMTDVLSSQASHVMGPNSLVEHVISVWQGLDFRQVFVQFCGAPLYYGILWRTKAKLRRIHSHQLEC